MKHLLRRGKVRIEKALGIDYPGSASYWEKRYLSGGTSGAGSTGRLAALKAEFLNNFVATHGLQSVIELGCGDGRQLALAKYPRYVGIDISREAIEQCIRRFRHDPTKTFIPSRHASSHKGYALALSLDVIYHLTEDEVYETYMKQLFSLSDNWTIIFSSNMTHEEFCQQNPFYNARHVKHRRFLDWIEVSAPDWRLVDTVTNSFPFDPSNQKETSFADFYVFKNMSNVQQNPSIKC